MGLPTVRTIPTSKGRTQKLKKRYSMTLEEYHVIEAEQGGVCAICGCDGGDRLLHVDHSHATGAVRGLLCMRCNTGLGLFRESPRKMISGARYLRERRGVV